MARLSPPEVAPAGTGAAVRSCEEVSIAARVAFMTVPLFLALVLAPKLPDAREPANRERNEEHGQSGEEGDVLERSPRFRGTNSGEHELPDVIGRPDGRDGL